MLTVSAYAAPAVNALPQGGVVSAGSAVISQSVGSNSAALTVNQSSQRAVIDWNSYNVGQNATVTYNQPNSQSSTLNRISDPNVSQIFGQIKSNGEVVLVNPEGVYFSPSSSVNVGALVATTNNISNSDYMNGKATYTRGNASGSVVNEGNITAGLGRYVALLAPSVRNSGIIIAQMGTAVLASGDVITLNFNSGNHLASITATSSSISALVENKNAVIAPGGLIILSARAANQLVGGVINQGGKVSVSNLALNQVGGRIVIDGDNVNLNNQSTTLAQGSSNGGQVSITGNTVTLNTGSTIDTSSTTQGNGGSVYVMSQHTTTVNGTINSQGGVKSGNGGVVETSSHGTLILGQTANINVSAQSNQGTNGTWVLDPYNLTIDASSAAVISQALNTGSVTLAVNSTGCSSVGVCTTGAGNLIIDSGVTIQKTSGSLSTLNLIADGSFINNGIINGTLLNVSIQAAQVLLNSGSQINANQVSVTSSQSFISYGSITGLGNNPLINILAGTFDLFGVVTTSNTQGSAGSINITTTSGNLTLESASQLTANGSLNGGSITLDTSNVGSINAQGYIQTNGGNGLGGTIKLGNSPSMNFSQATLQADGQNGGSITLSSNTGSINIQNSLIQTNGSTGPGGTILISGLNSTNIQSSTINAEGYNQGGTIKIGNDAINHSIAFSTITTLDATTQINASQTNPTNTTNGGYIETSGHTLNLLSSINAGRGGMWLMDPTDITIDSTTASNIDTALNNGSNVTIQTTSSSYSCSVTCSSVNSSGSGNITVSSAISATGSGSLTLNAYNNIYINYAINIGGGLTAIAYGGTTGYNGTITISQNISTLGNQTYNGIVSVTANVTLNAGAQSFVAELYTYSGGFTYFNDLALFANPCTASTCSNASMTYVSTTTITSKSPPFYAQQGYTNTTAYIYSAYFVPTQTGIYYFNAAVDDVAHIYMGQSGASVTSLKNAITSSAAGTFNSSCPTCSTSTPASNSTFTQVLNAYACACGVALGTGTNTGSGTTVQNGNVYSNNVATAQGVSLVAGQVYPVVMYYVNGGGWAVFNIAVKPGSLPTVNCPSNYCTTSGSASVPFANVSDGYFYASTLTSPYNFNNINFSSQVNVGSSKSLTIDGGVVLANSNTVNGNVNLGDGTYPGYLAIGSSNILSTTTSLNINTNSVLTTTPDVISNVVIPNDITLSGSSIINNASTNYSLQLSGSVVDGLSAGLLQINSGTSGIISMLGSNTYSGGTTVSAGTLKAGSATAFGTGAMTVDSGAVLDLNGQNMTSTGSLTLNGSGISGSGALINSSNTAATYAGLLALGSNASIVGGSGAIDLSNTGTIIGSGYTLTLGGSAGGSIASIIGTDSGAIVKNDGGTWTLLGANTYSGSTSVNAGTLVLSGAGTLGSSAIYSSQLSVASGAVFNFDSSANQTFGANISGTTGPLAGAGTFEFNGSGTVTLNGNQTSLVSGSTINVAQAFNMQNGLESIGGYYGGLANASTIEIKNGGTITLSGTGSNAFVGTRDNTLIIIDAGGTLTTSSTGTNAYHIGTIQLNGGTIAYGNPSATSNTSTDAYQFGTWLFDRTVNVTANSLISATSMTGFETNGVVFNVSSGDTLTMTGSFGPSTANRGVIKTGLGTLIVSGPSTSPSTWYVQEGTLQLGASSVESNGITTSSPIGLGTLRIYGSNSVSSGGIFDLNGYSITNPIYFLSQGNNTTGTLVNSSNVTSTVSGSVTLSGDATISGTGNISISGNVTLASDTTIGGTGNINISGVVSGAHALTTVNTGVLTLSAANTYTGATTIASGSTVQINAGGSINDTSSIVDNGTLTYNNQIVNTAAGVTGSGAINVGAGSATGTTLQLTGVLGVSGEVTVLNGNALDLQGHTIPNTVSIAGTGINNSGVVYNSNTNSAGSVGGLILTADSTVNAVNGMSIGTINGAYNLTINAGSSPVTFAGLVGTTTALNSLTVNGTNTASIGNNITVAQNITFQQNVLLTGGDANGSTVNPLVITSQNGNVTLNGTLTSGASSISQERSITLTANNGSVTFNNQVGAPLSTLYSNYTTVVNTSPYQLVVNANTINLNADITTLNSQTYNGSVIIGDNGTNGATRTFISVDPQVYFNGTVNDSASGAHTLDVSAASQSSSVSPMIEFGSTVGNTTPLQALNVITGNQDTTTGALIGTVLPASGNSNWNGQIILAGNVTTQGSQNYTAAQIALGTNGANQTLTFTVKGSGNVTMNIGPNGIAPVGSAMTVAYKGTGSVNAAALAAMKASGINFTNSNTQSNASQNQFSAGGIASQINITPPSPGGGANSQSTGQVTVGDVSTANGNSDNTNVSDNQSNNASSAGNQDTSGSSSDVSSSNANSKNKNNDQAGLIQQQVIAQNSNANSKLGNNNGNSDSNANQQQSNNLNTGNNNQGDSSSSVLIFKYSANTSKVELVRNITKSQLIIMKPNAKPLIDHAYEITISNTNVRLHITKNVDKILHNAGAELNHTEFVYEHAGVKETYKVSIHKNAIMIVPSNKSAVSFVDKHYDEIVGQSIVAAIKEFSVKENSLKAIYINLNE